MSTNTQNPINASDPHRSAVVKASAGVGKTYLLVTRLIRLLLSGVRPDAILAITFTRKAATEMQTRLAERLLAFVECDDQQLEISLRQIGVEPDLSNCVAARGLFERLMKHENPVKTTTFHAFCQDILRRFPMEADVPPAFELIEDSEALMQDAWDALYAEVTQNPDTDLGNALESLYEHCDGLFNTQAALSNFLDHRSDWWAYCQKQAKPVDFAKSQLKSQLEIENDVSPLDTLFQSLDVEDLVTCFELLKQHTAKTFHSAAKHVEQALNEQLELEQRFQHLCSAFLTKERKPLKRDYSKALEKSLGPANAQTLVDYHQRFCGLLGDAIEDLNKQKTYSFCCAWYTAGQALLDHYQRLKSEQRLLDFADLEWKTYSLLHHSNNAQWVQYKLDQRIEHFLIDEFQDTNPTQWHLILPLLEELASQADNRSAFIVGDDKQSIYAFRRAEPKLLDQSASWLSSNLGAEKFPMDKSRRSAEAIMQAVNRVFGPDQHGQSRLKDFHPHTTFNESLWGRVSVLPLIEPKEDDETTTESYYRNPLIEPRDETKITPSREEALQIASIIRQYVDDEVPIGSEDSAHPAQYADFMLLLRTRSNAIHFEQAFRENHIPYVSDSKQDLLDALEIQDLIALLQVLQAPLNNLALATVLRSPIFTCSNDDLISIVLTKNGATWYEKLLFMRESESLPHRLDHALATIESWRNFAAYLPIHDLLDHIYFEKKIVARYQSANPDHLQEQVANNLNAFINLALEVDSGRYPSIGRFLAKLEDLKQGKSLAITEDNDLGDRVRILTIHGSKGLEAPVVFVADTTSSGKSDKAYRAIVDWPPESRQPQHFMIVGKKESHDVLTKKLIDTERQRNEQESNNLLYVALTRARQHLYISGYRPNKGKIENTRYGQIASFLGDTAIETGTIPTKSKPIVESKTPQIIVDDRLTKAFESEQSTLDISPSQTLEDSEYRDDAGRHRGIAIHRFIELLSQDHGFSEHDLLIRVGAELGRPADDTLLQSCYIEAKETTLHPEFRAFFDSQNFDQAFNELAIQFKQGTRWVNGIIDRLIISSDNIVIIDYKTHRIEQGDIAQKALEYREQLALYRQGVMRLWPGRSIQSLLLFTYPGKTYALE